MIFSTENIKTIVIIILIIFFVFGKGMKVISGLIRRFTERKD